MMDLLLGLGPADLTALTSLVALVLWSLFFTFASFWGWEIGKTESASIFVGTISLAGFVLIAIGLVHMARHALHWGLT